MTNREFVAPTILGPRIVPTDDVKADMDRIRAFYRDMTGHLPERSTPILLEEELESGTPPD